MMVVPKLESWLLTSLGGRVALTGRWGDLPPGRTGVLISIQAALPGWPSGAKLPYVTVGFNLSDLSDEESVPLHLIRPLQRRE